VCDSNLLAASRAHFERVIDSLTGFPETDFNQGLDARRFTAWHAGQIARLRSPTVRFSLDHAGMTGRVARAVELSRAAGLRNVRVYVLIGFRDRPEAALARLEAVRGWGIRPNPMRYQPLDAEHKDDYVPEGWTDELLRDVVRYYSKLRWLEHVTFEEYRDHERRRRSRAALDGRGDRRRYWQRIARRGMRP
jgi:hypothetical protein